MSKRKLIVLGVVLVIVLGSVIAFLILKGDSNKVGTKGVATEIVSSDRIGMTVQKDLSLEQKPVSKDDEAKGRLWQFASPVGSQQEIAIDANYEQGASLKKLTGYAKQPLRDAVVANINLQLPRQYPEYRELTQRNLTINSTEANETILEYMSSGVKVKQRLVLYFKNSDTVIYIRAQAKASEYDAVNSQYFEPIFSSVKFE